MKTFYLINPDRGFRERSERVATEKGYGFMSIHLRDAILHLDDAQDLHLVHKNTKLELDSSDRFMLRARGYKNNLFATMVWNYLHARGFVHDEQAKRHHNTEDQKIYSIVTLWVQGIQQDPTIVTTPRAFKKNEEYILNNISFPLVFKENGSKGQQVKVINGLEELQIAVSSAQEICLIQKWHENKFDIRILLHNNEYLGAIKRVRGSGFLNNISQGAVAEKYNCSPELIEIAKKAIRAVGVSFAGVDMFEDGTVIEVNSTPGYSGFESVQGKGVIERVVGNLL